MKKHYRSENNCLNCGTTLDGKFCHNCGQENLEIKESFGHMMNHAISDYFHFDHQFFHTLKPLLIKPGYLTNEYMAGKRAQYLHPVKMYIFISLVYFVLLFQSGHEKVKTVPVAVKPGIKGLVIDSLNKQIAQDPDLSAVEKKQIQKKVTQYGGGLVAVTEDADSSTSKTGLFSKKDTSYSQYLKEQQQLPANQRDGFFKMQARKKIISYRQKYGDRSKEVFFDEFKHNIPKMMFLMLPLFALILKVTFSNNKKFYVEHLIYTFHLHCFLFIFLAMIMLLELIIPAAWVISDWINFGAFIYIIWYIFRSLKQVYHRSSLRTISKMIGMSIMYFIVFIFCVSTVLLITGLLAA
ncbi:DUF3667 domain-containing protein [Mucilaginibacter sp.]|uniref:DUF3667 domain-containing protein n=1 Tax=Mucilaginibacter sp. TaxID=1882438 RepID=UPI003D10C7E2